MSGERWTVRRVLGWTRERFEQARIESPRLDAEVLLAHVLGVDRMQLYLEHDKPLTPAELAAYRASIRRRLAREPVAYITGEREFWSLPFGVSPAVLVPRPETELLVELVLARLAAAPPGEPPVVVDVGTGSGALAVVVAREAPAARVVAIDVSPGALALARENARRHEAAVTFYEGDLLDPLPAEVRPLVVASNPPYIPSAELDELAPEVRAHEPRLALDGGPDGLALIRRLARQAARRLRPGGLLALEIHPPLAAAVRDLLRAAGLRDLATHRDLAGEARVVTGARPDVA